MRRFLIALLLAFAFACTGFAQQSDADAPASRADIERYLEVTHSRQMVRQMTDAMLRPMHQMLHDQYMREKDKLPADFEERMNRHIDEMVKSLPWDDMIDAMIPAYQKHFTKGDMNALVTFYGSQKGQKILHELPAVTSEAMQAMMPLMRKQMDAMNSQIQAEVAEMIKNSGKSQPKSSATN